MPSKFLPLLQLMNSIAIAKRGDCEFTYKASIAESGGAAGLIVINDYDGMLPVHAVVACPCTCYCILTSFSAIFWLLYKLLHILSGAISFYLVLQGFRTWSVLIIRLPSILGYL